MKKLILMILSLVLLCGGCAKTDAEPRKNEGENRAEAEETVEDGKVYSPEETTLCWAISGLNETFEQTAEEEPTAAADDGVTAVTADTYMGKEPSPESTPSPEPQIEQISAHELTATQREEPTTIEIETTTEEPMLTPTPAVDETLMPTPDEIEIEKTDEPTDPLPPTEEPTTEEPTPEEEPSADEPATNNPVFINPAHGGTNPFENPGDTEIDEHDSSEYVDENGDCPGEGIHF